jgi:SAM-dependent methyltransferase
VVIDLGAGTGRFVEALQSVFRARVIAVEPSRSMVTQREGPDVAWIIGAAEALPLADASADLAFVSMTYHHFRAPADAVAELKRVLRAGGWVVLRTATRETLLAFEWLRFFPESLEIDLARMPTREALRDTFTAAGFSVWRHDVVQHTMATSYAEYLDKIRERPFSSLQLLPDDVFERRLAELEAHCRTGPERPIREPVDLLVFRAPA